MRLSQYDRVVCLCVDKRYDREHDRVTRMLLDHGVNGMSLRFFVDGKGEHFPISFYDQITPTPPPGWRDGVGAYAHFCAMQAAVAAAKADRLKNLLWVEDDCVFTDHFDEVVTAATEQLRGLPAWDLLYYGANHTWAVTEELTPNVLRCRGSYTTHCVGIQSHMYDALLALPPTKVIDYQIAHNLHGSRRCYAVWPNVALQKPGYSFLCYKQMDYTDYFKSKGAVRK